MELNTQLNKKNNRLDIKLNSNFKLIKILELKESTISISFNSFRVIFFNDFKLIKILAFSEKQIDVL